MASTVRVLHRFTMDKAWQQASDEAKEGVHKRWRKLSKEWKDDPGIKYICEYSEPASDGGLFTVNRVFEVADALKGKEMSKQMYDILDPVDKFAWKIVFGWTGSDEFWQS